MSSISLQPANLLKGSIIVPGDKSISHRSIIFGALAEGETRVSGLLEGEDVLCTIDAFRKMGVTIVKTSSGKGRVWRIRGVGLTGLKPPKSVLYCGNSGTTMRLLAGILAACPFEATLTGDASLNKRPMGRVMEPLQSLGAWLEEEITARGRFLHVRGGNLKEGRFKIAVASAQLKTALLLAGLISGKRMIVTEPELSRDHTERMLKGLGAKVRVSKDRRTVRLEPTQRLKGQSIIVPGDISSAAFFMVAALIHPNPKTRVVIQNVGLNPSRTGIVDVLQAMGGRIRVLRRKTVCGEPVGDLECRASRLRGVGIRGAMIPRLIDEIPILSVAAALASGRTVIRDAKELRIKETDRIRALATELPKYGVRIKELEDGLIIEGAPIGVLRGATGLCYGDHRMAMSQAVLSTVCQGPTKILETDCIATSFPNFIPLMKKIGANIKTL